MKRAVLFAAAALLLLTACGRPARGPIILPDPAEVERVVLTGGRTEIASRDDALIARLLRVLKQAVPAGEAGLEDMPEGAWSVRVDFGFRSGGESRIFLCRRDGVWLLVQPFQGVWKVDGRVWDLLAVLGDVYLHARPDRWCDWHISADIPLLPGTAGWSVGTGSDCGGRGLRGLVVQGKWLGSAKRPVE